MTENYEYGGARALVELHAKCLRRFVAVWREAKALGLVLAPTDDLDCKSLDHVLHNVMASAASYLAWCCEVLEVDAPDLPEVPGPEAIADGLDELVDGVLDGWRSSALRSVPPKAFYSPAHTSRWRVPHCVDAMREHPVMHPIRHEHQLGRLLAAQAAGA